MGADSNTEPYQPSNSTDGESFISRWCGRCQRQASYRLDPDRHDACPILVNSMAFNIGDPEYPREWVRDDLGPRCAAFVPEGDAETADRRTVYAAAVAAGQADLFGAEHNGMPGITLEDC